MLTLATLIEYNLETASLICLLLAVTSTIKTRVLLSSIFFIADSVVNGNLIVLKASNLGAPFGVGALGFLANFKVCGL